MSLVLQSTALISYGVGSALALVDLSRQGRMSQAGVPAATGVGLLATVAVLALRGTSDGRWPVANADEALLALAACVAFLFLCIDFSRRLKATQAFFLPALVLLVLASLALQAVGGARAEVGPGALMAVHMITVVGAGTAYTSAFVGGSLYLMHSMLLHRKQLNRLFGKLPALETLENFNYRSAAVGFPLLTIAVLTGFLAFGRQSASEPTPAALVKIGLAVAAWVGYGVLMVFIPRFRARLVAQLNVVGFFVLLAVLLTAKFAFN